VSVETGLTFVGDTTQPVTTTLPGAFTPATLATTSTMTTPHTTSYWQTPVTPQSGDGLYRFYSRAGDLVSNSMADQEATTWYRGAFIVDSTPPTVTWLSPADGATTTAPVALEATVSDYVADGFSVADFFFEVDGEVVAAQWAAEPWSADPVTQTARTFWAWAEGLAVGSHTMQAVAQDEAGNEGRSATITLHISGAAAADTTPPVFTVTTPLDNA
jgi:hypothetical protein